MYTTRPLSLYKHSPETLSQPPDGPNSGYLVIQDEESTPTCCFGLCKNQVIRDLPFPQNKLLSIEYHVSSGEAQYHRFDQVYLIPVINQPLSSNLYYAIKAEGNHKGEAYASSKEEDKITCCFCIPYIKDVNPRAFDHENIYQQFEFSVTQACNTNMLLAKSVAVDGHPPRFLRTKGWQMIGKTSHNFTLEDATGLDSSLRAHLPDFNFPITEQCSKHVVIGKWYSPFMFIHEGTEKERIKHSVFYEINLEQRWEKVFTTDNSNVYSEGKVVRVDVVIPTLAVRIDGKDAKETYRKNENEVVWFRSHNDKEVGLSKIIVERMLWEEEKVGWIKGKDEKQVRIVKDVDYEGVISWRSFGCYVLVESFVVKRNDGSVVMTYDFMHTHSLQSKWD